MCVCVCVCVCVCEGIMNYQHLVPEFKKWRRKNSLCRSEENEHAQDGLIQGTEVLQLMTTKKSPWQQHSRCNSEENA